jgi:hypothetical protein
MRSRRGSYRDSQEAENYHQGHNFGPSEPRVYIRGVSFRTAVSDEGLFLFGSYKGKHVTKIAKSDPCYIEWCYRCRRGFPTEAYKFLKSPKSSESSKSSESPKSSKSSKSSKPYADDRPPLAVMAELWHRACSTKV